MIRTSRRPKGGNASDVTVTDSGLTVIAGATTTQEAVAKLNDGVLDAQIIEGGYVENDTAKPGGTGAPQVLAVDPPQDLLLMTLAVPMLTRPIYISGRAVFDVTAAPATSKSGNCQLVITDELNTDLEQEMAPIEAGGGTGGYVSKHVMYRIPPNTPARTYRLQASKAGDATFGVNVMHGALAAAFRTWLRWERR